jgi:ParB-like chromosome segregation protein Spo0J
LEWGWTTPVLVDEAGSIIAGHGRVMAAQHLGLAEIPVMVARGWTEVQKRAYVLADNKLALDAGWDAAMLELEVADLEQLGANMIVSFDDILGKGLGVGGDAGAVTPAETWAVIVECRDEDHQVELIQRMQAEGLKVKASIA